MENNNGKTLTCTCGVIPCTGLALSPERARTLKTNSILKYLAAPSSTQYILRVNDSGHTKSQYTQTGEQYKCTHAVHCASPEKSP
eukprot:3401501-Rhodomonas_salina.3